MVKFTYIHISIWVNLNVFKNTTKDQYEFELTACMRIGNWCIFPKKKTTTSANGWVFPARPKKH